MPQFDWPWFCCSLILRTEIRNTVSSYGNSKWWLIAVGLLFVLDLLTVGQNVEEESFLSHTALNNSVAIRIGRIGMGGFVCSGGREWELLEIGYWSGRLSFGYDSSCFLWELIVGLLVYKWWILAVVSCFFFYLRCIRETAFPKCSQLCLFCCSSLGLSVWVSWIFFFLLLMSGDLCEIKELCLDFRALLLTGMELLSFASETHNLTLIWVSGSFPCMDLSTELQYNYARMQKP